MSEAQVTAIAANPYDQTDVKKLIENLGERFGRIDILVINTGGPPPAEFEKLENGKWHEAFGSMLISAVMLTKSVLPGMKSQKWGRILNITSIPMNRLGEPGEFGSMVAFLASERAAYVTGTSITVDGGWVRSLL